MTESSYPDTSHSLWPVATPKHDTPIGNALRAWRKERRLSQSKLAKMLCVDHSAVSRIEAGGREVGKSLIPAIARVTGWDERDVSMLICGYDPIAYREEIEACERGRIVRAVQDALGEAA